MSLVRSRLALRSGLNAHRYRSPYACLLPLQTYPEENNNNKPQTPSIRSYHSLLNQNKLNYGSVSTLNLYPFQSYVSNSSRSISTFNFVGSSTTFESIGVITDWVLQSGVTNVYVLHNVADVLASLQHLLALLNAFTFSQWWVWIIVTSLLIRGVTIPVMVDSLNWIAKLFTNLGSDRASAQGGALVKNYIQGSVLSRSPRVMYTMLHKEYLGVKGSIIGEGVQVPVFWFSMEALKQNMGEIVMSCLRGKTLAAELVRNRVLSKGRVVLVVGEGFGLEIQMFDLDFSLILRRRQDSNLIKPQ